MKLMLRFNLILLLLFGTATAVISHIAYGFLDDKARAIVLQQAGLMMANAQAVRDYTSSNIEPLLRQPEFHPERVPNFASIATFKKLPKQYSEFVYKETALNPRNPEHRPEDWEAEVVQWLRQHPNAAEYSRTREFAYGPGLFLARPIKMEIECMECHSTPDAAPQGVRTHYPGGGGFGWDQGDRIIGAQIVTIPMTVPLEIAHESYRGLMISLIVTLVATMLAVDAAVYWFVVRPLEVVSSTAHRVSTGEKNVPPLPVKGKDEISKVNAAFNRMQVSLAKALRMLDSGND